MEAAAHTAALESEGRRLLDVAAPALDAVVPTCPGWDVRELLTHVAWGWQAIDAILSSASLDPPDMASLPAVPPGDDELLAFAGEKLATIVDALGAADPARPVWSYTADHTTGFWQRRIHHETFVHRVDAELAVGAPTVIDAAEALDGIDELFTVVVAPPGDDLPAGSLHLHRTDGDGEFMLTVVDGAVSLTREHAKGDAALRGSAADLWLVMWGRRSVEGMEFFGDSSVLEQWTRLAP